jgi:hypothetical protein
MTKSVPLTIGDGAARPAIADLAQIDRAPPSDYVRRLTNTPSVIEAVRKLRNHEIDHLDLRITEPHKEGHSHG